MEAYGDVESVCSYAEQYGFGVQNLRKTVDIIISPSFLDQKSRLNLLKSLLPSGKVPADVVYAVVNSLGLGARKPGLPIQQSLLKWLIMIYPVLEDLHSFSTLYSVLFNMLDIIALRSYLTHLLALITRKKHVKPFRIQMLINILKTVPREPGLDKISQIYESYAPGHIELSKLTASVQFPHPDPAWGLKLKSIQEITSAVPALSRDFQEPYEVVIRPSIQADRQHKGNLVFVAHLKDVAGVAEQVGRLQNWRFGLNDLRNEFFRLLLSSLPEPESSSLVEAVLPDLFDCQLEDFIEGDEIDALLLESAIAYAKSSKVCSQRHSL